MGWAEPGPTTWVGRGPAHLSCLLCMSTVTSFSPPADVHCARLAWRGKKCRQNKRGGGLTWSGGDAGGCWRRRHGGRRFLLLLPLCFLLPPLSVFLSFSFLFLSSFLFFSLFPLLCSLSLSLGSFFFFSVLFFFSVPLFFVSPVFIEKQGRRMAGAATVLPPLHRPSNTWKA